MDGAKMTASQWALINSGATDNFIDAKAAQDLQILFCLKSTSVLVETIDGSLLFSGPVTQETVPLEAIIHGHWEVLQFNAMHPPDFPLIIGITWLEQHGLCISWGEKRISFPSKYF